MNSLPFLLKKKEIIIKKEAVASLLGIRPEDRSTEELLSYGLIILNKPSGPTSHQIVDYVKHILSIRKAGHSGTLDPKVTGVLPIALDKATRVVQVLLTAGKEYVCLMHLHHEVDESTITKTFTKFSGEITQLPPVRSAVKRQERKRRIYYIDFLEIEGKDVLFRIGCQAGTYIRKFVHDFGKTLGCGAHMVQLIRTRAGPFSDKEMVTLHDVKDAYEFWKEGKEEQFRNVVLPFERAVDHLDKIWVMDGAVNPLCHGSPLYAPGIVQFTNSIHKQDLVALFTLKQELIGVGIACMDSDEILKAERGIAVDHTKIFMERGKYILQ